MAKSGVLNNKNFTVDKPELKEYEKDFKNSIYINDNVVIDENIITAKPCGYMDFALEIGKKMGIYNNVNELEEAIGFFKFYKEK